MKTGMLGSSLVDNGIMIWRGPYNGSSEIRSI